jgi:TatD DNase family protein
MGNKPSKFDMLPTLDAHAHLSPKHSPEELQGCGAVLAMTLSLKEAGLVADRRDARVVWGAGCHPRSQEAQAAFEVERFRDLVEQAAIVGEIGLDGGSRVPFEVQRRTFRAILKVLAEAPRLASIHSDRATAAVVEELSRQPVSIPVLHRWTGTALETQRAVELGCYFSIHSAVARHSKFRNHVPPERILIESDQGYRDPPGAIPSRIEWVEHLVAQQYELDVDEVRRLVWQNFSKILEQQSTKSRFPPYFTGIIQRVTKC